MTPKPPLPDPAARFPMPKAPGKAPALEAIVAENFAQLQPRLRVRVLRRLLLPLGPLALAALGGGAFAKFVAEARLPRMAITLEDAARVSSGQVLALVRHVEQCSPEALQQVAVVLARDANAMAAVGLAAVLVRQFARRGGHPVPSGGSRVRKDRR